MFTRSGPSKRSSGKKATLLRMSDLKKKVSFKEKNSDDLHLLATVESLSISFPGRDIYD